MENIRDIAEMHYQQETHNEADENYKQARINVLEKLLTEQLNIAFVSKQSELLIAFHKFQQDNWSSPNAEITENVVDVFLKSNL